MATLLVQPSKFSDQMVVWALLVKKAKSSTTGVPFFSVFMKEFG
jgi:hypothetical protein